jgi:formate-dependent nitrite reductase membrane component NrfD
MNLFVADPDWGGWIIAYFFLGGIAAGSYFVATLIEWFGRDEDRDLARIAYVIAFPLILLCTVFLIVDLSRPERFWHMMFKSEIARRAVAEGFPFTVAGWRWAVHTPMLKYFSPMSAGSWGLAVFGGCAFLSFVVTLRPEWRVSRWLRARYVHGTFQFVGCVAAFFVASYTGGLLSATNQPVWSDTVWLSPLFLASAASTSLATMTLIAWWRNAGTLAARDRLAGSEPFALGLELVVLGAFLASLGEYLFPVLLTVHGNVMIFGTLILGILAPLLIHGRVGHRKPWGVPAAATCALVGGLLLRYGVVELAPEMLRRGPAILSAFAPEEHRERGEPGADPGNHAPAPEVQPRTKLPPGDGQ